MGILTISDAKKNDNGKCIDLLVVAEEYRRQGLATHMLDYAINDLGANWLIVKKDNAPAIKLYKKYGFKSVGEFKGKTGPVIRMEYNINAVESVSAQLQTNNDEILTNIINLNLKLNSYDYGLVVNGKRKRNTTPEDWDMYYHLLSPNEMDRAKSGVCWDYTTYEADYIDRHLPGIVYNTYYIQWKNGTDEPTHTFVVLMLNNSYYYFESSYKKYCGIWKSDSISDILNFVMNNMRFDNYQHEDLFKYDYLITTHDASNHNIYGASCTEFMQYCQNSSTVKHTLSKNFKKPEKIYIDSLDFATESALSMKSVISEDFKPKGLKSLSSFKCVSATPELREKYKKSSKMILHTYATNKSCKTIYWLDGDDLVALVSVNYSDPNYNWITALEVTPNYRGYGLGKQLLEYAISRMNGNALGVASDNEVAMKMYHDRGFRIIEHKKYSNSSNTIMALESFNDLALVESASKIDSDFKDKKRLNLSSFKVVKIDKAFLDKYKDKYSHLLDGVNPTSKKETSVAWLDDSGEIVAGVSVKYPNPNKPESYKDGNLIRCLEIYDDYRGHGLSEQVLDYAVKKLKGNSLYVMTDNEVAIKVYKDYGFKITPAGKIPVKYGKGSYYQMTLTGIEPVKESALKASERTDFGLPETKQYPMPDKEHVLLAIKFFNHVREDLEEELARNINKRIKELDVRDINIGDKNRFKKYYTPVEDSVMTGYSPIVGYQESWS